MYSNRTSWMSNLLLKLFSSSEPKVPEELNSIDSGPSASSLLFASSAFSNTFSSETPGPISIKFHIQHPGNGRLKIYSNGPDPMARMATMPIYGKNLKKSFPPEPLGWLPWNLVCSIRLLSTAKFVQMVTLDWRWPIFHQCQIWFLGLLDGKRWNIAIF